MVDFHGWSRRDVLRLNSAITGSLLAGCLSARGTPTETTTSPTPTTTTSPPPCTGDRPLEVSGLVVQYDRLSGFSLTTNTDTVQQGETLVLSMENVTSREQASGNSSKYDIHRRTDDTWVSISGRARGKATPYYHDDAVSHPPGEGFTWELEFTQAGLSHEIHHGGGYFTVCSPITPGTYRFVYWGLGWEQENERDSSVEYALGVRFTVTES